MEFNKFTQEQNEALTKQIDKSQIATRSQRGMTLSYVESYYVIEQANSIFGFDGWNYEITSLTTKDYPITKDGKSGFETKTTALVRVTVRLPVANSDEPVKKGEASVGTIRLNGYNYDSVSRHDVGNGSSITYGATPDFEGSEKEAVSDALKRALRTFGNQFGNSLYDKDFLKTLDSTGVVAASRPVASKSSAAPAAPTFAGGSSKPASEKQIGMISTLLKRNGKVIADFTDKDINALTSTEASGIIDRIQAG